MDLGIRGRNAIVFGASRGIGFACSKALCAEGATVTLVGRSEESLEKAAAELRALGGGAFRIIAADMTTAAGRASALAACPTPDIVVNSGDSEPPGDFREWTRDDWLRALDKMMLSPIEIIRATVDGMLERGFGRIVNIVSRSVKIPQLEMGLSNGARSGLVGFTAGLARQTVRRNVTINNILPGIFATDAQRAHVRALADSLNRPFDEVWNERSSRNPAGRYGEPGEVAAYVAFLCSTHAGYITGQNVLIDGGEYPGTY